MAVAGRLDGISMVANMTGNLLGLFLFLSFVCSTAQTTHSSLHSTSLQASPHICSFFSLFHFFHFFIFKFWFILKRLSVGLGKVARRYLCQGGSTPDKNPISVVGR
ncbi:hypothetical protein BDW42DRAFT_166510 [Aspergillus taichungensis]|uniref:Uncharacterized protein n=1 Tax=Aspergillus taichungensis TaxID=482145 RepID=A0A2J5HYN7_9EURO|nr:hypothetical protein BDW42DRAFT_166510 [Aspergillus taichungensis]